MAGTKLPHTYLLPYLLPKISRYPTLCLILPCTGGCGRCIEREPCDERTEDTGRGRYQDNYHVFQVRQLTRPTGTQLTCLGLPWAVTEHFPGDGTTAFYLPSTVADSFYCITFSLPRNNYSHVKSEGFLKILKLGINVQIRLNTELWPRARRHNVFCKLWQNS